MIKKTYNYEMFKLIDQNRAKIDQQHVKRLAKSIEARNLLDRRPIMVNAKHEILDGQHRFLAAKSLGVEIYYDVQPDLKKEDIIVMNVAKAWGMADFMNFYLREHSPEYLKLDKFMKKNNLQLRVAITMTAGQTRQTFDDFRKGDYKFKFDEASENIEICWETNLFIKRMHGYSAFLESSRWWKALLRLVNNADFDANKWRENLKKMVERIGVRATTEDYAKMLMDIYNWRNNIKVDIIKEEL